MSPEKVRTEAKSLVSKETTVIPIVEFDSLPEALDRLGEHTILRWVNRMYRADQLTDWLQKHRKFQLK